MQQDQTINNNNYNRPVTSFFEVDTQPPIDKSKVPHVSEAIRDGVGCLTSRRNTMINMASKNPELVVHAGSFDTDPMRLNCANGIVDLKTGIIANHSPNDLVIKLAPFDYDPNAACPTFLRFLNDIFNGDVELISYVQRSLGYTLTGMTIEHAFFVAYGTGANGKSTLFESVLEILGDYGRAAEFDTFLVSDKSSTRAMEGIAKLQGIRFALASETGSTRQFSEALLKKLTGGDTVTGSFLYNSSFEFQPNFKLWFLANHLPEVNDGSVGFWRRVKIIPFARQFTADEIDQTLHQKLMAEAEGILAWLVQGAMEWSKAKEDNNGGSGIGTCAAVESSTFTYRTEGDPLKLFVIDCLVNEKGEEVSATRLFDRYEFWCSTLDNMTPMSQVMFSKKIQNHMHQKKRKSDGYFYIDVRERDGHFDEDLPLYQ